MLAEALQAEVDDYIARHTGESTSGGWTPRATTGAPTLTPGSVGGSAERGSSTLRYSGTPWSDRSERCHSPRMDPPPAACLKQRSADAATRLPPRSGTRSEQDPDISHIVPITGKPYESAYVCR
jgi:hypothetical protein